MSRNNITPVPIDIDPPTNLTADAISTNTIILNWNAEPSADFYRLFRSTSMSGPFEIIADVFGENFIDTGLNSDTTYYYAVISIQGINQSSPSNIAFATTFNIPPPLNITATALSSSSIEVSWDATSGAIYYQLYRSTSANGTYSLIANTPNITYTDTGLNQNTTYYYKVSAVTDSGSSDLSNYAAATTFPQPQPPINLQATAISYDSILVTWSNQGQPVDGYYLYRALTPTGPFVLIDVTNQTNYIDVGLAPNTTYYYRVQSYIGSIFSDFAGPVAATTFSIPAPEFITATAVSASSIEVEWTAVPGADFYTLYRSTSPFGPGVPIATALGSTNYLDAGLDSNTTYYYWVSATFGSNESSLTGPALATTFPDMLLPPSNLEAFPISTTEIDVIWNEAPGAAGYNVYRSTSPDGPFEFIGTTTDTIFNDTGLEPGTTYYYMVEAFNNNAVSDMAGPVSATTFEEGIPSIYTIITIIILIITFLIFLTLILPCKKECN